MSRTRTRWAVLVVLTAIPAGCGNGSDPSDSRDEVESMIRSQLPRSVLRNTGQAVFVNAVTCVDQKNGDYECIARVSGADGVGNLQSFDLPIDASCDEANCTWRSAG